MYSVTYLHDEFRLERPQTRYANTRLRCPKRRANSYNSRSVVHMEVVCSAFQMSVLFTVHSLLKIICVRRVTHSQ